MAKIFQIFSLPKVKCVRATRRGIKLLFYSISGNDSVQLFVKMEVMETQTGIHDIEPFCLIFFHFFVCFDV